MRIGEFSEKLARIDGSADPYSPPSLCYKLQGFFYFCGRCIFYHAGKEKKENSKYKISANFELKQKSAYKHSEPTQTQDTSILWKYMSLSKTITFGYFSIGKSII